MTHDAVVVGSGAGGLCAAAALSRAGADLLVREAMAAFGGYLNPFCRAGHCFDTGMHDLGRLGQGGPRLRCNREARR